MTPEYHYDDELFARCLPDKESSEALHFVGINVETPGAWDIDHVKGILKQTIHDAKLKNMKPLYTLFYGRPSGLPLPDVLALMGRDWTRERLYNLTCWEDDRR